MANKYYLNEVGLARLLDDLSLALANHTTSEIEFEEVVDPETGETVKQLVNPNNFISALSIVDYLGGSIDLSGYVPTSTTINGQALTSNIVLTANDVNALPSSTVIPDLLSDLSDDSTHRTVTDAEKSAWNSKSDFSGSYNDLTDKPDIDSMEDSISQIEDKLEEKVDKIPLKGLSTNDYTNVEKDKLSALPTNAELSDALSDKVDKVPNKGLSTNDYTTEDKNKLAGLENYDDTTVRQLISDTNANFANYYTKVQTYSQTEVDTMLRTQRQGRFVVADTLPDASEETMFIIYLVPNSNSETQNVKDEFITLQNGNIYSWEQIGSTSIDLSDYPTIQEMNDAIADAIVGFYTKPSSGIPKSDLAPAVQASLNNADTALQSYTETDPTVPSWAKAANKPSYTAAEVGALPSDTFIPTKTSDLTNDSDFITSADLPVQIELTSEIIDSLWEAAV